MAEPLATVVDIEAAYRPLTESEQAGARNALVLTSQLVRSSAARVDERMASGDLDPDVVKAVVVAVIVRTLRNPEGARTRAETVGPFTTSLTFADTVANLALLPSELRLLQVAAPGTVSGLGTMRLGSAYPEIGSRPMPDPIGRHPWSGYDRSGRRHYS